jgi:hypothetical protein
LQGPIQGLVQIGHHQFAIGRNQGQNTLRNRMLLA